MNVEALRARYRSIVPRSLRKLIRSTTIQPIRRLTDSSAFRRWRIWTLMIINRNRVVTDRFMLYLDKRDMMAQGIFLNHLRGNHLIGEALEVELFKSCLEENQRSVFVDIGASYGLYTLESCVLVAVGKVTRAIAVEPHDPSFKCLSKSVRKSGFEPYVDLVNAAAGHISGPRVGFREGTSGSADRYFGCSRLAYNDKETTQVAVTTIDKVTEELGVSKTGRFVFKIDVEGYEPLVLAGMRETLEQASGCQLFLEFNPDALAHADIDPLDFASQLWELGADQVFAIYEAPKAVRRLPTLGSLQTAVREAPPRGLMNLLLSKNMSLPRRLSDRSCEQQSVTVWEIERDLMAHRPVRLHKGILLIREECGGGCEGLLATCHQSNCKKGHVIHGPYCKLSPARYSVSIWGSAANVDPRAHRLAKADICYDYGRTIIKEWDILSSDIREGEFELSIPFEVEVQASTYTWEFRIYYWPVSDLSVKQMILTRMTNDEPLE
jgi:FkbM family methyltransferase